MTVTTPMPILRMMVYLLVCAFSVLSSFVLTPPLSEIGLALHCNQPVAVLAMI